MASQPRKWCAFLGSMCTHFAVNRLLAGCCERAGEGRTTAVAFPWIYIPDNPRQGTTRGSHVCAHALHGGLFTVVFLIRLSRGHSKYGASLESQLRKDSQKRNGFQPLRPGLAHVVLDKILGLTCHGESMVHLQTEEVFLNDLAVRVSTKASDATWAVLDWYTTMYRQISTQQEVRVPSILGCLLMIVHGQRQIY
eukprot:scaffold74439_cov33-Prasinocladus_malaysianus.AAC.5